MIRTTAEFDLAFVCRNVDPQAEIARLKRNIEGLSEASVERKTTRDETFRTGRRRK